ncbi:MAG: D-2-hydroxyacid dehydrogenase [Chloroflexi bacterium]|nr:D-2-hydroxyacid dehydrogenase [Chloroflexota bacterium]
MVSDVRSGDERILVSDVPQEDLRQQIRDAAESAPCHFYDTSKDLEAHIELATIVAGSISPAAFARAQRLRWLHSWAAGIDGQLFPELVQSPVILTCSKSNGAVPLAEHAIMLMLLLDRNALRWLKAQEAHHWDHFVHGELNGLTCGIIGLGYSGQDLAEKAKAFHMRVLGLRRHVQPTPFVDEVFPREGLLDLLKQSDFVVVTAPRTPETIGMLGEREFRAMKPSAYYICFSRGGIADDAALLRALREGWIAGAGLDAHGAEPLTPDSPFWTAPNTIITPHNGASTPATRRRGIALFIDNLRRYTAGQPLRNVVDKHAGY